MEGLFQRRSDSVRPAHDMKGFGACFFFQFYTGEQNSSPVLKIPNVELKAGSGYPPHNGGE
jgi:hypothetical protein